MTQTSEPSNLKLENVSCKVLSIRGCSCEIKTNPSVGNEQQKEIRKTSEEKERKENVGNEQQTPKTPMD